MSKRTLEDFFDAVRSNQRANRVAYPQSYAIIERIDDCFARAGSNLVNPTPMMTGALFLRCHYAFKTAAGMAFAGQAAEVFSVLRSVLEYAGYCLVIWETPMLEGVFVLRHAGDLEMREQKKAFQGKGVTEAIARQDANLANCYSDMYQRTIDFGAHPIRTQPLAPCRWSRVADRPRLTCWPSPASLGSSPTRSRVRRRSA